MQTNARGAQPSRLWQNKPIRGVPSLSMTYLTFPLFPESYRLKTDIFLKCALLIELNRYKRFHIYKIFAGATRHPQRR